MQYLATNATDVSGLLQEIRDFLDPIGWSVLSDGTGGGGTDLEMTNSNGHDFKFSSGVVAQTDYVTGAFNDRYIRIQLQGSDFGDPAGYDVNNSADTNDLIGPFPNVYLFGDDAGTYCNVVVQVASLRFTHFSFGDLDNLGLHTADIPFAVGMYHTYWQQNSNYISNCAFNDWASNSHAIGHYSEGTGVGSRRLVLGIPDGVMDPALGFTDGPVNDAIFWRTNNRYIDVYADGNNVRGVFLDYFTNVDNQGHTGGCPIFPIPMVVQDTGYTVLCLLGELPYMGQVNMTGLSAGQILDFSGEEWMVFPAKQYGTRAASKNGASPLPKPNSLGYGFAYRKT